MKWRVDVFCLSNIEVLNKCYFFLIQSLCSSLLQILCNGCISKSVLLSFLNISGSCTSACCCTSCFLFRILWMQYLNRLSGGNYIILTNSYFIIAFYGLNAIIVKYFLLSVEKQPNFLYVSPARKRREKC